MKNKVRRFLAGSVLLGTVLTAGTTFASTTEINRKIKTGPQNVVGIVSTVSGNTLIINSKKGKNKNTTYTVDATNAKITKDGTSTALTSIAIGDTVVIKGKVKGTNVTAKSIRDSAKAKRLNKTT
ncbi:MAG: hypothetical protein WCJ74_01230 [bacterium]